jgi:hypothetical protein
VNALGRLPRSQYRSQLEADYATYLELKRRAGQISYWAYEPMTLNLGGGVKWKPDWLVMLPNGELEIRETKGYWRRGERERIKIASAKFPFRFIGVTCVEGDWIEEPF